MTKWVPSLSGRSGPLYRQISDAIAEAVQAGALAPGDRLAPQRDLAYALGVSLNTVTRGYDEAVGRGLLAGEVGRGTYVREQIADAPADASLKRASTGPIDFARNLPAPGAAADLLPKMLAELSRTEGMGAFLDYEPEGNDAEGRNRAAGARWIAWSSGISVAPESVMATAGAQHGILAAMMAVLAPGDTLLVEPLSYAPIRALAQHVGVRVVPVPGESDRPIAPEALEAICRKTGARALFCMPTLQTPTATTMTPDLRQAIAGVARRQELVLIEDDVFGFLPERRPPPLAAFAPERTIYITGVGKCLGPGLRVGYLSVPERLREAVRAAIRLSVWMPPPLTLEIAARWIGDGTAERLALDQRRDVRLRQEMAARILGAHAPARMPEGYHLWLGLPVAWPAAMFMMEAERRGVKLVPGSAFAVNAAAAPNAVRLCLSHEPNPGRVERGLSILSDILGGQSSEAAILL